MKRASLLLSAILIASFVYGQQGNNVPLSGAGNTYYDDLPQVTVHQRPTEDNVGRKTTSATQRWYNYGGQYQYWNWNGASTTVSTYGKEFSVIWFDTSSHNIYPRSPFFRQTTMLSYGQVLHPWAAGFNDTNFCGTGEVAISAANAYTVDSLEVLGIYRRNPATSPLIKDTLRVSLVEGDGITGNITPGTWSSITGKNVIHDSLHNVADNTHIWDIILGVADVTDTDAAVYRGGSMVYTGLWHKRIPVTFPVVPAGHYLAMTVTFKSGDPAAPHMPPGSPGYGDTVHTGSSTPLYKYGMFRPYTAFHKVVGSGIPGSIDWPVYDPTDINQGVFRFQPSPGYPSKYVSMWGMGTSTAPSELQYSTLGFHLTCVGCGLTGAIILGGVNDATDLGKIQVTPNPANGLLNISFTQADATTASVTLTNMVGLVVSDQSICNGKAIINTSALPAGMYIYTVRANGGRVTGRVVIAH